MLEVDINYSLLWMKELLGPKVLCIAPTVVSLTMSTAEKPISYCSLRGYLALTSCLPMERRFMIKTAWRQGGDVTPLLKHWTLTVYISRPICIDTKPAEEPWQYIRGCINNNNDHVIKGNHSVFLHDTCCSRTVFFDRMSGCLFLTGCVCAIRTTSSSESSRPWMLLLSRTACWCLLPLVWLNRCTSEVICKQKHSGQRSLQWTQWRQRQERVKRDPWDTGETIHHKGLSKGQKRLILNVIIRLRVRKANLICYIFNLATKTRCVYSCISLYNFFTTTLAISNKVLYMNKSGN